MLTTPDIEPVVDADGNPVLNPDGSPQMRVTGYGIWSKIEEIFEANKKINLYWLDV